MQSSFVAYPNAINSVMQSNDIRIYIYILTYIQHKKVYIMINDIYIYTLYMYIFPELGLLVIDHHLMAQLS